MAYLNTSVNLHVITPPLSLQLHKKHWMATIPRKQAPGLEIRVVWKKSFCWQTSKTKAHLFIWQPAFQPCGFVCCATGSEISLMYNFSVNIFCVMYGGYGHSILQYLCMQINKLGIRPLVKWAVSLMIATDHFKSSSGFVCVNIFTYSPSNFVKNKYRQFTYVKLV